MADDLSTFPEKEFSTFFDPTTAADFFLGDLEDPNLALQEWWLHPNRLALLRIIRTDPLLWASIGLLSERAYLGTKKLMVWLDGMARMEGTVSAVTSPALQHPSHTPAPTLEGLLRTKDGHAKETLANLQYLLRLSPWYGDLWWNALTGTAMYQQMVFTDQRLGEMTEWLQKQYGMPVRSTTMLTKAVEYVASLTTRNPLQDWLSTLRAWDGLPRIASFLSEQLGAPDTPRTTWLSRVLFLALVDRIVQPGNLQRFVPILEGREGLGKTAACQWLAGEGYYLNFDQSADSKEIHMAIRGKLVVEFGELAMFGRTQNARLKSFLTMRSEQYVPKYANFLVEFPRSCVFIGTVNHDTNGFLERMSENTRFFPIEVRTWERPDMGYRAQCFAEAMVNYQQCTPETPWWDEPLEMMGENTQVRQARQVSFRYEELLDNWLETQPREAVSMREIYDGAFEHLSPDKRTKALEMEIAETLRHLGWERGIRERRENRRERLYRKRPS